MNPPALASVPRAELILDCRAGEEHRLRWENGELTAPDHPDATRERALAALGADPYPCLEIIDRWLRHADDLGVLVLGSRGVADQLAIQTPHSHRGHSHGGHAAGWSSFASSPMPGRYGALSAARMGHGTHHPGRENDELGDLLSLGSGLSDRLVATVVARWVDRIVKDDDSVPSAMPSLHAALYGRAVLAIRTWLGEPAAKVTVQMGARDALRMLVRDADGIHLEVPFAWLLEVWAVGVTTVLGRFCLQAEQSRPGCWELTTVGADFDGPSTIRIDATPAG